MRWSSNKIFSTNFSRNIWKRKHTEEFWGSQGIMILFSGEEGYIQATPNRVTASETSNINLNCSVLTWSNCWFTRVELTWKYENETLQNNNIKYTIREHQIDNKCKNRRRLLFSLEIINVTYKDDGMYFCQMSGCNLEKPKSSPVLLHTVAQPRTGTVEALESDHLVNSKKWS